MGGVKKKISIKWILKVCVKCLCYVVQRQNSTRLCDARTNGSLSDLLVWLGVCMCVCIPSFTFQSSTVYL